jgi:hypothetical protein
MLLPIWLAAVAFAVINIITIRRGTQDDSNYYGSVADVFFSGDQTTVFDNAATPE